MASAVVAVFDQYNEAEGAMNELLVSGFDQQQVRLSAEDEARPGQDRVDKKQGIKGWFSALFGTEQRDEDASLYDQAVKHGNYVVTAIADDDVKCDIATEVFRHHHPIDLDQHASEWMDTSTSAGPINTAGRATGTETQAIPVVEEQVKVGKREFERGGVRVFQKVTEVPVQDELKLKEERVIVDRVPVDRPASTSDLDAFKEGTIEVRERAEEPVISKTARVVEEVRIGKETTQRTEHIRETVRRTDVQIERLGEQDYRAHWQENYAALGSPYDDYAPAYDFGSTASKRYRGREWNDVEPDLRRDWESKDPNSPWERFKDSVRYAFTGRRSAKP